MKGIVYAAGYGKEGLINHWLEVTTCENLCEMARSTLQAASCAGHETIVRLLLHKYTTTFTEDGVSLAHIALKSASADSPNNAFSLLLKDGTRIVTTENAGDQKTPLNMACRYGHFVIARLLVEYGAAINGRGEDGPRQRNKPLIDAIGGDHSEIARWLVEEGADIFRVGHNGVTALWSACHNGNEAIARLLIDSQRSGRLLCGRC
jgi:ankyrin repeat protein